ncbi:hypothetical protein HK098_001628 [Nowakowskiella sp. JEL0407]|nr:hypothetical protein HK098_001628 [Nowakowskiella sp. JEL0407]
MSSGSDQIQVSRYCTNYASSLNFANWAFDDLLESVVPSCIRANIKSPETILYGINNWLDCKLTELRMHVKSKVYLKVKSLKEKFGKRNSKDLKMVVARSIAKWEGLIALNESLQTESINQIGSMASMRSSTFLQAVNITPVPRVDAVEAGERSIKKRAVQSSSNVDRVAEDFQEEEEEEEGDDEGLEAEKTFELEEDVQDPDDDTHWLNVANELVKQKRETGDKSNLTWKRVLDVDNLEIVFSDVQKQEILGLFNETFGETEECNFRKLAKSCEIVLFAIKKSPMETLRKSLDQLLIRGSVGFLQSLFNNLKATKPVVSTRKRQEHEFNFTEQQIEEMCIEPDVFAVLELLRRLVIIIPWDLTAVERSERTSDSHVAQRIMELVCPESRMNYGEIECMSSRAERIRATGSTKNIKGHSVDYLMTIPSSQGLSYDTIYGLELSVGAHAGAKRKRSKLVQDTAGLITCSRNIHSQTTAEIRERGRQVNATNLEQRVHQLVKNLPIHAAIFERDVGNHYGLAYLKRGYYGYKKFANFPVPVKFTTSFPQQFEQMARHSLYYRNGVHLTQKWVVDSIHDITEVLTEEDLDSLNSQDSSVYLHPDNYPSPKKK